MDTLRFRIIIGSLAALILPCRLGAQTGPRSVVAPHSSDENSASGFRVLSRPPLRADGGWQSTRSSAEVTHGIIEEVRKTTREQYEGFWVNEDHKRERLRMCETVIQDYLAKGDNAQAESFRRRMSKRGLEPSRHRSIDVMEWFNLFRQGVYTTDGIDPEVLGALGYVSFEQPQKSIHPFAFAAYLADLPGGEPVSHAHVLLEMLVHQLEKTKESLRDADEPSIDEQLGTARSIMAFLDAHKLDEAQERFDQAWQWVLGEDALPSSPIEDPVETSEDTAVNAEKPSAAPLLLHRPDPLVSGATFLQKWYTRHMDEITHNQVSLVESMRFQAKAKYLDGWYEVAHDRKRREADLERRLSTARNELERARKFRQRDVIGDLQKQMESLELTLGEIQREAEAGAVVPRLEYVQGVAKAEANEPRRMGEPRMRVIRSLLFFCDDLAAEQREQGGVGGTVYRLEQLKQALTDLARFEDDPNSGPLGGGRGDQLIPCVVEVDDIIELLNSGKLMAAQERLDAKWDWIMTAQVE